MQRDTQLKSKIEKIWRETLTLDAAVSLEGDRTFIDLGGTSLLANQIVQKIEDELEFEVSVLLLFEHPTFKKFCAALQSETSKVRPSNKKQLATVQTETTDRDVAIIGISCRLPGAENLDEFWKNLLDGRNSITHFQNEDDSKGLVNAAGMIKDPYDFDAKFFGISAMEAKIMDPQQRLLLEESWKALELSGYGPGLNHERTAVFAGTEDNSYYRDDIVPFPQAEARAGRLSIMTGNEKDFAATRIAHKLNLKGPAITISTACSTSLVATVNAIKSLRNQDCDLALVSTASVWFPRNKGYSFQEGGIFSPDGACRPFDKNAQGTVFTDGVASLVLKRAKDAIEDKDQIFGIIKGGAINNDGADKAGFSAPSIQGQSACILAAQKDAGIDARSLNYIEAHGTATPMGDPIELEGLRRAFKESTNDLQFCGIGSVKSNIGHTTATAGSAGMIKAALALKNKVLPPTVHFTHPNPKLDIENSPFFVVRRATPLKRGATPLRAGISSFGIGGTNAHVIIEEPPLNHNQAQVTATPDKMPFDLFPVSARSDSARKLLLEQVKTTLSKTDHSERDLAHTLQSTRSRQAFPGVHIHFKSTNASVVENNTVLDSPKLTFVFPGQGSQYIGMGKSFYEDADAFPVFKKTFDICDRILSKELGLNYRDFIFDLSNAETLQNTRYTQPALFAIEVSLGRQLLAWGLQPELMLGHSIGEFSAACLAGIFSIEDGLHLISERGRLMAALPTEGPETGKMLSVRGPIERVRELAKGLVEIGAINSPIHSVLSGSIDNIKKVQAKLEAEDLPCKFLHTSHAFHSQMMNPVVDPFLKIVQKIKLAAPQIPILSTVSAELMSDEQAVDPQYWAQHLRATVDFSGAAIKAIKNGANLFLEVGPRKTLASLLPQQRPGQKNATPIASVAALSDQPENEIKAFAESMARLWIHGFEIPWSRVWSEGKSVSALPMVFEHKTFRFSEGRQKEQFIQTTATETATMSTETSRPASNWNQKTALILELKALFEGFSGTPIESHDATFVESGFDSLVLIQVAGELQQKYGIRWSIRDLMEDFASLNKLAAEMISKASVDLLPKEPVAAPAPLPAPTSTPVAPAAPAMSASIQTQPILNPQFTGLPAVTSSQNDLTRIVEQQLLIMRSQLELLSGQRVVSQPLQAPMIQPSAPAPEPKAVAEVQEIVAKLRPAAKTQKKDKGLLSGVILKAHIAPPHPDAMLGKDENGEDAWFRFNSQTKSYEQYQDEELQ